MKKLYCLLSMCLISYGIFGQQKDISLSFDINDFEFNTNNGILYVTPLKTYSFFKSQNAEPALPWIIVKVLIGADQDLTEFSYSRDESLLKSDVLLGYNPKTLSTNDIKQSQPQSADQIIFLIRRTLLHSKTHILLMGTNICAFAYHPLDMMQGPGICI